VWLSLERGGIPSFVEEKNERFFVEPFCLRRKETPTSTSGGRFIRGFLTGVKKGGPGYIAERVEKGGNHI
jgi:hypothetical protein